MHLQLPNLSYMQCFHNNIVVILNQYPYCCALQTKHLIRTSLRIRNVCFVSLFYFFAFFRSAQGMTTSTVIVTEGCNCGVQVIWAKILLNTYTTYILVFMNTQTHSHTQTYLYKYVDSLPRSWCELFVNWYQRVKVCVCVI